MPLPVVLPAGRLGRQRVRHDPLLVTDLDFTLLRSDTTLGARTVAPSSA